MSTQSIIHNNNSKINVQVNKFLRDTGKKYLLKKRFSVGKGVDMSTISILMFMSDILCKDDCLISNKEYESLRESINKLITLSIPEL